MSARLSGAINPRSCRNNRLATLNVVGCSDQIGLNPYLTNRPTTSSRLSASTGSSLNTSSDQPDRNLPHALVPSLYLQRCHWSSIERRALGHDGRTERVRSFASFRLDSVSCGADITWPSHQSTARQGLRALQILASQKKGLLQFHKRDRLRVMKP